RLDELMIRQDDMPWQGRATVFVDLRRNVHTPESLELTLSAAASIADASYRRRALVRLVMTDGTEADFGSGPAHLDLILERLAGAQTHGEAKLVSSLTTLRRSGGGGSLAVVTTARAATADFQGLTHQRSRYGTMVLVM